MKNNILWVVILVLISLSLNLSSQTCSNPISVNDYIYVNNPDFRHTLRLLDARCAWTITTGSRDVIVGVIDTEFDVGHPDLINTFVDTVGAITYPIHHHGTMVSGCVATGTNNNIGIAGIGYNTRVKGYNVNGATIWNGIQRAYQDSDSIKIINVSWNGLGLWPSEAKDSIQKLIDKGIVLIVGADNDSMSIAYWYLADIDGVIIVSGVDTAGRHWPTNTARNGWVDVCAFSKFIGICQSRDLGAEYRISGFDQGFTSFAAPQVAGVVALMRSIKNDLTPAQIENMIKETVDRIPDDSLFRDHGPIKPGRVNAYRAVLAARNALCASPPRNITGTINTTRTVSASSVSTVGTTTVTSGNKLTITACNSVTINSGFTVQPGAEFEIRIYSP
jgi:subtilisin family serine protease